MVKEETVQKKNKSTNDRLGLFSKALSVLSSWIYRNPRTGILSRESIFSVIESYLKQNEKINVAWITFKNLYALQELMGKVSLFYIGEDIALSYKRKVDSFGTYHVGSFSETSETFNMIIVSRDSITETIPFIKELTYDKMYYNGGITETCEHDNLITILNRLELLTGKDSTTNNLIKEFRHVKFES